MYSMCFNGNFSINKHLNVKNRLVYDWDIEYINFDNYFYIKNKSGNYICYDIEHGIHLGEKNILAFYIFEENILLVMFLSCSYHLKIENDKLYLTDSYNTNEIYKIIYLVNKDINIDIDELCI